VLETSKLLYTTIILANKACDVSTFFVYETSELPVFQSVNNYQRNVSQPVLIQLKAWNLCARILRLIDSYSIYMYITFILNYHFIIAVCKYIWH
jgi:hypothetical protein